MTIERVDPPYGETDRAALRSWLDYHRATLLVKCEGLDATGLGTRPVPTSMLSLHGLVRHMAEVERSWFQRWWAETDVPMIYCTDDHEDGDFELADGSTWVADLAIYQEQVALARQIEAAADSLDVMTRRPGRDFTVDRRWIMLHMIEEYARHNGHADLIRELVDGTVGD